MIIQIRGTSGSGKSHLVKEVMKLYANKIKYMVEGRRQPIAYTLNEIDGKPLTVIGHYEAKCGGCDTIAVPGKSYQIIFDLIKTAAQNGNDVLFEGLLISGDVNWTLSLKEFPLMIIQLTTSLEDCISSINDRRKARLGDKFTPVKEANTITKYKLCEKVGEKLKAQGIIVEKHSRESALERIKAILHVH